MEALVLLVGGISHVCTGGVWMKLMMHNRCLEFSLDAQPRFISGEKTDRKLVQVLKYSSRLGNQKSPYALNGCSLFSGPVACIFSEAFLTPLSSEATRVIIKSIYAFIADFLPGNFRVLPDSERSIKKEQAGNHNFTESQKKASPYQDQLEIRFSQEPPHYFSLSPLFRAFLLFTISDQMLPPRSCGEFLLDLSNSWTSCGSTSTFTHQSLYRKEV